MWKIRVFTRCINQAKDQQMQRPPYDGFSFFRPMQLLCSILYIYPLNPTENRRRWFVVFNAEKNDYIHNHPPLSEWKISPVVLQDIINMAKCNIKITTKDMQKGIGLNYQPIEASLAAANIGSEL